MKNIILIVLLALGLLISAGVSAGDHKAERIAQAESAGPPSITAGATIMDSDGTLLREGDNGWICLPDTFAGDNAPMCNDGVWMKMLGAFAAGEDFETNNIGISYMLAGEPPGSGVSNSNPHHADHQSAEDYVETGPHLMIIVPREMLEGITDDPGEGGPFVMWGDTPYAHIMVPVAAQGE